MAKALPPYDDSTEEEDYIDMEISSGNNFLCYTIVSAPHSNEFEFQMSVKPAESEATTSPADELFYKGKLLPLHLPPRLQMVKKLLENSKEMDAYEEKVATTPTTANTADSTPFKPCNISPASSRYISGELNAEVYYRCSAELIRSNQNSSWSKKPKLIKQLSRSLKLKSSKAYLKSLFNRRGSSGESCTVQKLKECSDGNVEAAKKNPLGQSQIKSYLLDDINALSLIGSINGEKHVDEDVCHRKSFSGAINWSLVTNSSASLSSSSSSLLSFSGTSSNGLNQPV